MTREQLILLIGEVKGALTRPCESRDDGYELGGKINSAIDLINEKFESGKIEYHPVIKIHNGEIEVNGQRYLKLVES